MKRQLKVTKIVTIILILFCFFSTSGKIDARECMPANGRSSPDCNGGNCVEGYKIEYYVDCWVPWCNMEAVVEKSWCSPFCDTDSFTVGVCQQILCNRNDQCLSGEICNAGVCGKPDGAHCSSNSHCASNEKCVEGLCRSHECNNRADCGDNQHCIEQGNGLRACQYCLCPPGFLCSFVLVAEGEFQRICTKIELVWPYRKVVNP